MATVTAAGPCASAKTAARPLPAQDRRRSAAIRDGQARSRPGAGAPRTPPARSPRRTRDPRRSRRCRWRGQARALRGRRGRTGWGVGDRQCREAGPYGVDLSSKSLGSSELAPYPRRRAQEGDAIASGADSPCKQGPRLKPKEPHERCPDGTGTARALRCLRSRCAWHGSFSRAADELCVTQSAVSHQIRGLRGGSGASLFRAPGNRATLLPHAVTLAQALERSFEEIGDACSRARRAGGPPKLTIAAIPSVAVCWLIPRLDEFRALTPATEVRLVLRVPRSADRFPGCRCRDRVCGRSACPGGAVVEVPIRGETAPVCAPHLGLNSSATGADMVRAGLLHDADATGWRTWLQDEGEPDGVRRARCSRISTCSRAAALADQGIALCPLAIVSDDLLEGQLIQLSEKTIRADSGYYVLIRDDDHLPSPSVVKLFRDWILSTGQATGASSIM